MNDFAVTPARMLLVQTAAGGLFIDQTQRTLGLPSSVFRCGLLRLEWSSQSEGLLIEGCHLGVVEQEDGFLPVDWSNPYF